MLFMRIRIAVAPHLPAQMQSSKYRLSFSFLATILCEVRERKEQQQNIAKYTQEAGEDTSMLLLFEVMIWTKSYKGGK